jgi:hypothetical protein
MTRSAEDLQNLCLQRKNNIKWDLKGWGGVVRWLIWLGIETKWSAFLLLALNLPYNCRVTVTKLHALRSQQNLSTLQQEQRGLCEWRHLRTPSAAKVSNAVLLTWTGTMRWDEVFLWPWRMPSVDGYYTAIQFWRRKVRGTCKRMNPSTLV